MILYIFQAHPGYIATMQNTYNPYMGTIPVQGMAPPVEANSTQQVPVISTVPQPKVARADRLEVALTLAPLVACFRTTVEGLNIFLLAICYIKSTQGRFSDCVLERSQPMREGITWVTSSFIG